MMTYDEQLSAYFQAIGSAFLFHLKNLQSAADTNNRALMIHSLEEMDNIVTLITRLSDYVTNTCREHSLFQSLQESYRNQ